MSKRIGRQLSPVLNVAPSASLDNCARCLANQTPVADSPSHSSISLVAEDGLVTLDAIKLMACL